MDKNIFIRSKLNPILSPNPNNPWETFQLYNPGAIYHNNKFHLFYRALGHAKNWQSVIGYAVSNDGKNFKRFDKPLLVGDNFFEKRGLEDPRITKINNTFYMAYAAYDGLTPRLSIATSKDLKKWTKHGPCLNNFDFTRFNGVFTKWKEGKPTVTKQKNEWSKAGGIFPEKIQNKYWMLFGEHRIWLAHSDDGINWQAEPKPFLAPRKKYFDNTYVEMGPPPIKTNKGWLVLYHGIGRRINYRLGFLLLDLENPYKIIYRSSQAIFEPQRPYEIKGLVDIMPGGLKEQEKMSKTEIKKYIDKAIADHTMPAVVFCCGAILIKNKLRIYYGAGDSVICTAVAKLDNILNSPLEN